jgi:uncharacterized Tic20 family protein
MNAPAPAPISTTSDDKIWVVLSHLSIIFGVGILLPLIVYLVKKDDSATVSYHAREALNFHISVYLYMFCCVLLFVVIVGIPLAVVLGVVTLVLSIVAAVQGAEGKAYRYPFTIRFIQ